MPSYNFAHVREQGVDLILVPLESSFGVRGTNFQNHEMQELQRRARDAGFRGTVVPVWDNGGGRMAFLAPTEWAPFLRGINLQWVQDKLNRELTW